MIKSNRFLKAIRKESLDATPIWIMRQAGRYLPEYRAVRAKAGSFMTLCKTPELACEVTLQPLARYPLDAAIIFSDILTIPDAMGMGLEFTEGKGPYFNHQLRSANDIRCVAEADLEKLQYVYQAIQLVSRELDGKIPLIGFCGSPWTVAAYMIEGQSYPGFPKIQQLKQENPQLLHTLLDTLAKSITAHLHAQIQAGASAVMLFDTWGGMLDTPHYQEFSLHYVKKIIEGIKHTYNDITVPVILFTKGGGRWLEEMAKSNCDVLGVDWEVSLTDARARVGSKVALQGNLNPECLLGSPEQIRQEVQRVIDAYGNGSGHIFNLGHGITPNVPPENVTVLVDAVHELSKPYHEKVKHG